MSGRSDYIPANAGEFNVFLQKILQYVGEHEWENIPQERRQALTAVTAAYDLAFHTAVEVPTKGNILARRESQAAATKVLREFVNQFLRFRPVTNVDRSAMGIPNHDTVRTDHVEVTEHVAFDLSGKNDKEVTVSFWVKDSDSKAKPAGYDGAVIVWDVLDEPPAVTKDLSQHEMASRTPHILKFEDNQRGKFVYVALAWQNERGKRGTWTSIRSTVIP